MPLFSAQPEFWGARLPGLQCVEVLAFSAWMAYLFTALHSLFKMMSNSEKTRR